MKKMWKNFLDSQQEKPFPGHNSNANVVYYWKGIHNYLNAFASKYKMGMNKTQGMDKELGNWGVRGGVANHNLREMMDKVAKDIEQYSGIDAVSEYKKNNKGGMFSKFKRPKNDEPSTLPLVMKYINEKGPSWIQLFRNLGWTLRFNFFEDHLEWTTKGFRSKTYKRAFATGFIEFFEGINQPQGNAQIPQPQFVPQAQPMGNQFITQQPQMMMNQMHPQPVGFANQQQGGFTAFPQNNGGYTHQQPAPLFGQMPQMVGQQPIGGQNFAKPVTQIDGVSPKYQ